MSERFDHVLFWVFFPANAPTLKLFFSKFLVPVDTSYMPVIIKNIVVSDPRAELELSEFPFTLELQEAADTTMVYSHRTVSYVKHQKVSWRLLVLSMFRPDYGVVVTGAKRPRSKFFKRMVIDVATSRPSPSRTCRPRR